MTIAQGTKLTKVSQIMAWAVLVFAIAILPILPEVSTTVAIALSVLSIPIWLLRKDRDIQLSRGQLVILFGALLFFVTLLFTTSSLNNFVVLLAILPVAFSVPLSKLLATLGAQLTVKRLANIAMAGLLATSAVTAYDVYIRGFSRGGVLTMNPIHMPH